MRNRRSRSSSARVWRSFHSPAGWAVVAMVIAALGLLLEIYVAYLLAKFVFGGFDSLAELASLGDNSI